MKGIRMMDLTPGHRYLRQHNPVPCAAQPPKTRQELVEAGICTQCKRSKATPGNKTCKKCRDYQRNYRRRTRSAK